MHRTYVLTSAALATLLASTIVIFCFLADPYAIYPSVAGSGEEGEVDLFYHLRIHKPYAMASRRAQHLIIGSSRSASLPPQPLAAPQEVAYNASLPGVTLREMRRMLEHAQVIQPLKSVVVGVDYYMFRQGHSDLIDHYEDSRLYRVQPSLWQSLARHFQRFEDNWKSLLSVDVLLSSWQKFYGKDTSQRRYYPDGTWKATPGTRKSATGLFSMLARQKYQDFSDETDTLDPGEFNKLLEFCAEHNIRVSVLISPFHASIMNTVDIAGKWESYLQWQRMVIKLSDPYADTVQVYGLENSPQLALEAMEASPRFFHDGVHYTRQAGRQIMSCLTSPICEPPIRFTALHADNIDAYLAEVNELMRNYPDTNPRDHTRLLKWLAKMRAGEE